MFSCAAASLPWAWCCAARGGEPLGCASASPDRAWRLRRDFTAGLLLSGCGELRWVAVLPCDEEAWLGPDLQA